jgi:hypothetical protein
VSTYQRLSNRTFHSEWWCQYDIASWIDICKGPASLFEFCQTFVRFERLAAELRCLLSAPDHVCFGRSRTFGSRRNGGDDEGEGWQEDAAPIPLTKTTWMPCGNVKKWLIQYVSPACDGGCLSSSSYESSVNLATHFCVRVLSSVDGLDGTMFVTYHFL